MVSRSLTDTRELSTVPEQRTDKMGSNIRRQEFGVPVAQRDVSWSQSKTTEQARKGWFWENEGLCWERDGSWRGSEGQAALGIERPQTQLPTSVQFLPQVMVYGAEVMCGCELPVWVLRTKPRSSAKAVCFATAGAFLQP